MQRQRTLLPWLGHALLALGGLVVSIILIADKVTLVAGGPSTCGVNSGCEILGKSAMSEIPGIGLPIAVLGAAFYLTWLVLTALRLRGVRGDDPEGPAKAMVGRSIQILMGIGAIIYSIVLLAYSISEGVLCKFCVTLYVINTLLFVLTLFSGRITPAPRAIGVSPLLWLTTMVFLTATGIGFAVYKMALPAPMAIVDPLADPGVARFTFDVSKRASIGPENAPIQLVEFADFECPHCKEFYGTLEAIVEAKPDLVRVTFLSFPIDRACNRSVPADFHQRACELAVFGECANRQGKYGDVAAMLYESGKSTERAGIIDQFVGVGLDRGKLEACLADPSALEVVKADIEQALKAGVDGTPALFMNGVQLKIRPLDYYLRLVDEHADDPKP